jgi:hypothetical protein
MLPLSTLSAEEARGLRGVLFDLDDTLLDAGALGEAAYSALFRLRESGLTLIGVTGRPVGWAEVLLRQWPVAALVAENGAIACVRRGEAIVRIDALDAEERQRRRERTLALVARIRAEIPGLEPADDVAARACDFTFDIGERHRPSRELVARAAALVRRAGGASVLSSVHLHVGFDRDDKASGALRVLRTLGEDATQALSRWAAIGDSDNDAPLWACFHTSIGVANWRGRPSVPPRFVTRRARGAGFAEAAELIGQRRLEDGGRASE